MPTKAFEIPEGSEVELTSGWGQGERDLEGGRKTSAAEARRPRPSEDPMLDILVDYELTKLGRTLRDPLIALAEWVRTHRPAIVQAQALFDAANRHEKNLQRGPSRALQPPVGKART